jgi:2-methylcitrate dehydratase PrpD
MSQRNAEILRYHRPRSALEAKFSIEFAMAAMLHSGRAGFSELSLPFINSAEVQALMAMVSVDFEHEPDPERPGYAAHDRVVITTGDGRVLDSGPIKQVRGEPDAPLTRDEFWKKFEDCVTFSGLAVPAVALFETFMDLAKLDDARSIRCL